MKASKFLFLPLLGIGMTAGVGIADQVESAGARSPHPPRRRLARILMTRPVLQNSQTHPQSDRRQA